MNKSTLSLCVPDGYYSDGTPRPWIEVDEVTGFHGDFVHVKLVNGTVLTAPIYAVVLKELVR